MGPSSKQIWGLVKISNNILRLRNSVSLRLPPPTSSTGFKGSLFYDDEPVALCVVSIIVDHDNSRHAVVSFAGAGAMDAATEVPGSRTSSRLESPSCHRRSEGGTPDLGIDFESYKNPFIIHMHYCFGAD